MDPNIKVSVVMPVYNVKKYLRESLDSVINQTLKEIEVICVDDGSTDGSSEILDQYASKDKRITVVHKENTGYGNSMNIGLDHAGGKYIAILEPDDFVMPEMYRDLYEIAEQYRLDLVKSDFFLLEGEQRNYHLTPVRIWWQDVLYEKILPEKEKKLLFKGWIAQWTALYNRDFLNRNGIRYHETPGASYQDTGFWFQTLMCAEKVYLHGKNYYHYRQDNPGSSMNDQSKVYCITEEYNFIFEIMKKKGYIGKYLPQYIACRFYGHRDTVDRIAEKYRLAFIKKASEDFLYLEKEGLLDESFLDRPDQEKLNLLVEDPEAYYEKYMLAEKVIHDLMEGYNFFYIYGAGSRAKKILSRISLEDKGKLLGFVVTKRENNERVVHGQPVYELDEVRIGDSVGVVIGVTERYRREIENTLSAKGVHHFVNIEEGII